VEPELRWHRAHVAGGCIIRSAFLGKIKEAFVRNSALSNLLLTRSSGRPRARRRDPGAGSWPPPCAWHPDAAIGSALAYYDGYRCERLPANLLQAQRDYFGAHTYERVDKPRGQFFHTNWTGRGARRRLRPTRSSAEARTKTRARRRVERGGPLRHCNCRRARYPLTSSLQLREPPGRRLPASPGFLRRGFAIRAACLAQGHSHAAGSPGHPSIIALSSSGLRRNE